MTEPILRSAASRSATARSRCSARSTSTSTPARSSRCSGKMARASPRCPASSPGRGALRGGDDLAGAALCPGLPARGDRQGPRPDPPGAQAPAGALDRRERLRRPLADEGRPRRSRRHGSSGRRSSSPASTCASPATRKVQGLSTAQQQLVEIAKALALNAKLLILDEPTAALGGAETEALFEQVASSGPRASASSTSRTGWRRSARSPIASSCCATASGWRSSPTARRRCATVVESMVGRSLERMFPPIPRRRPAWCWRCGA